MSGAWTRLLVFLLVFAALALWEGGLRRRAWAVARGPRWAANLGLQALNTLTLLLIAALGPYMAFEFAQLAEENRWGLLHQVRWHFGLKLLIAFVLLDLTIYLQHRAFHRVPALWRLHKVHHTDLDLDLTTGLRFHPGEIALSQAIKLAAVAAIGAHFIAVLLFEIVLNASSMFTHANARLPFDGLWRLLIVTPDMHRVHHSVHPEETNSNYGFNLSWWDRLLGSYRAQPRDGHGGTALGLAEHRDPLSIPALLRLPFRRSP